MRRTFAVALLAIGAVAAQPVHAQAGSCAIPAVIPVPKPANSSVKEPVRKLPVGGYTLSLSWSPEHCRSEKGALSFQCGAGPRFGFILHGLWPDGQGKLWPQYCRPAAILPPKVVSDMLCTTPSADLIQHEWAKHGTCMANEPTAYFAEARKLYQMLRFPDMMALSRQQGLTVDQVRKAFAKVNSGVPGLTEDAVRVTTSRNGWLSELWLCLNSKRAFARCERSQGGGKAPAYRIKIWRGGKARVRD